MYLAAESALSRHDGCRLCIDLLGLTETLVVKELISQKPLAQRVRQHIHVRVWSLLRTGVHVDDLKIMAKEGSFMRMLKNSDEAGETP